MKKLNSLSIFLLLISIYMVFLSLTELVAVDGLFLFYEISNVFKILLWLTFGIIFSFAVSMDKLKVGLKLSSSVFIIALLVFNIQSKYHDSVLNRPYIKSLNFSKVIQGDVVEIYGRGFGEEWEHGAVFLGDTQLVTKKWADSQISVEVPVPEDYGIDSLYTVTKNGLKSNHTEITIYDPTSVLNGEVEIR